MTAQISVTTPFPIFTDVDGNPLDDGYVYVGTAGLNPETNPITVYWDSALTIPAVQPIRTLGGYASRNGTPGQLYANAVNYSMLVKNKNSSLVWSSLYGTGISPNAAGVNYSQGTTNAQTRDVQGKLRELPSLFDYMSSAEIADVLAKTYNLDVSASVQKAFDDNYGRALLAPAGGYGIGTAIAINGLTLGAQEGTFRLIGEGAQTIFKNAGNILIDAVGSSSNRVYMDIMGIQFLAGSIGADSLVKIDLMSDWSIRDCEFRGAPSGAVSSLVNKLLHLKGAQHSFVQGCAFTNADISIKLEKGSGGIIKPNENTFISNNFVATFDKHFDIVDCAQALIIGNSINTGPVMIDVNTSSGGGYIDIIGNHFEGYTDAAIRASVGSVNVQSNRCPTTTVGAYDLDLTGGSGHRAMFNDFFRNVRINAACQDVTFGENTIESTCVITNNATTRYRGLNNSNPNADAVGTFTPGLTFATPGDLSVTYSFREGRYQRVGNRCRGTIYIDTSAFTYTTASGAFRINGLPFPCSSSNSAHGGSVTGWQGITKANYSQLGVVGRASNTEFNTFLSGSGQTLFQVTNAEVASGGTVKLRINFDYEIASGS